MTLDEAIKHAEEVMVENLEKTKGKNASDPIGINCFECAKEHRQLAEWLTDYKRLLEQQPSDTVSRGAFEQVMWERDVAIGQLEKLGYGLGEKIEPCDDAISRKSIKQKLQEHHDFFINAYGGFSNLSQNGKSRVYEITNCISMVVNEPLVTPTQKYGKWIKHPEIETSTPEYLMFYECSECGDKQCFCKSDIHKKRFCSNCGAKLQESEERND